MMGGIPTYIMNTESTNKTYWPLINEPGTRGGPTCSNQPNELEILNPTLDIKKWTGHFHFRVTNMDDWNLKKSLYC